MEKKLVTINTSGPIKELAGGINGPILTPTYISVNTIYRMLTGGKKIYEINPGNRKQSIILTKENYKKDNFNTSDTSDIIPKIVESEKKKEEARIEALAKEAERIAEEDRKKNPVITQEVDPDIIPIHSEVTEEVVEETINVQSENTEKEPSAAEGFDISHSKKNKKHGDFRK